MSGISTVVGHCKDAIAVSALIDGAVIMYFLVQAQDRAVDHFLGSGEDKSAEDNGEGKEDLLHNEG